MLFSSLIFVFVFLPIVLIGHQLLKGTKRNYFLLVASLTFYAWGEPKFVIVMASSIVMNYCFGRLLGIHEHPKNRKLLLVLAVIGNMSILFIFKYLNFTISNIDRIFADLIPQTHIVLPIGVSFFTFQAMSYVIDVYRGHAHVQKNPFFLGLYISLFPQLIAGPIVRYTEIESSIYERKVSLDDFGEGARRFMIGFSKKILIANNLALITDWAFESVADGTISTVGAWLGAICYAMQIYFDFGGYSDMAIGLGRMLGFRFSENFIYPYSKGSMKGFWTENHVSLCNWFRDYIYFPLGGSKCSTIKTIRNMLVVWGITGIWHGASWTFLIWGLVYFVILVGEKYLHLPERFKTNFGRILYRCFTLLMLVLLNGVLFRNIGFAPTMEYIGSMFMLTGCPMATPRLFYFVHSYGIIVVIGLIYATSFFRAAKNRIIKDKSDQFINGFTCIATIIYGVLFLVSISYIVMGSYNPFIYFNF